MGKRSSINHQVFVREYMNAFSVNGSAQDVAYKLKVHPKKVYAKTMYMRKLGVKLPKLAMGDGSSLNVDALNGYIEKRRQHAR